MEGVGKVGTGQGTCSRSLDCVSVTAAKENNTREGPHKNHHQISASCARAVILCPGRTAKNYEATQNWVYRLSLHFFLGEWLLAAVCFLALSAPTEFGEARASGRSPHFSLLLFWLTSNIAMGENFLESSQPLCLFLPQPLPLLLNSSRSTRQHGLPSMSSLPFLDTMGEREPSIISTYLEGKYRSLSSFWGRKQKIVSYSYPISHSEVQPNALFSPVCHLCLVQQFGRRCCTWWVGSLMFKTALLRCSCHLVCRQMLIVVPAMKFRCIASSNVTSRI